MDLMEWVRLDWDEELEKCYKEPTLTDELRDKINRLKWEKAKFEYRKTQHPNLNFTKETYEQFELDRYIEMSTR